MGSNGDDIEADVAERYATKSSKWPCRYCSCGDYSTSTTGGACETVRDDGNICGHRGSDHDIS